MDNREDPTPNKSNPSSLALNHLHVPATTSSINSNVEGNNHPPSRTNKKKQLNIYHNSF